MDKYKIPLHIDKLITKEFCLQFMKELHCIWGFALEDFEYESVGAVEGTSGWYEGFTHACRKTKNDELYLYYLQLDWYNSDLFDYELTQKLVNYKLLLPETEVDEIARQNLMNYDDIGICNECSKYFNKNDMIEQKEDDDADELEIESLYTCYNCEGSKKVKELVYDKEKAIKSFLTVTENDYFICPQCHKIHHIQNKSKNDKTCIYCSIEKVPDTSVNEYYYNGIKENQKYHDSLISKKYQYKNYETEVKYSYEDEVWYGQIFPIENHEEFKDSVSFHSETFEAIQKEFEEAVDDYLIFRANLDSSEDIACIPLTND